MACVVGLPAAVVVGLALELDDLLLLPHAVPTAATNPTMTAHFTKTRPMLSLPSPVPAILTSVPLAATGRDTRVGAGAWVESTSPSRRTVAGMSGRELVESPADDAAPDPALAPILEQLEGLTARSSLVQAFARAVLRRVPAALLAAADPAPTAAVLADAFAFVDQVRPGQIGVRVIDPEVTLDGRHAAGSLVEIVCEDRQFIVTTVREELHRLGHEAVRSLHPVLGTERGPDGRLVAVVPVRSAARRDSFLSVELGDRVGLDVRGPLVAAIGRVLDDVFTVTGDHDAMRERVTTMAAETRANAGLRYPAGQVREAADLLEWLLDGNFVLSGCCDLLEGEAAPAAGGGDGLGSDGLDDGWRVVDGLGILARPDAPLVRRPPAVDDRHLMDVAGTTEMSTVHRQVPMHCIDVARVLPSGDVAGLFRVVGVLSHR
ncbi:MAG: glutamate dehydrogenase, partial [Acidimicrobiaceae bacterium]